ncbi:kinase-like protein [Trematosphaeria pertusa]|uniref:Kinase-like protein n=1 Tax=Trematosphaeria pertusa TaxID=390896 RepID=A0A6A6IWV1_9PLEO|nr:kinase-like protein [Trematosphaeria pertusa]KAF2254412.1 kinase-like protein [Trematosphaeria pertusa]
MVVTNDMLKREENCIGITAERKYYHVDNAFIKRSLRPHEWQLSKFKGTIHVPRQSKERLLNEAACLRFIRDNSDIPVPTLHCTFEDDGAVYLVMEYVRGVGMDALDESQRATVVQELEGHLQTLRGLQSSRIGGPSGHVVLPYRASRITFRDDWNLQSSETDEFVFCHNDLSQKNVIVDPDSLKIAAIIDWEYAGFYPEFFERRFFERHGPSSVIDGEEDDSQKLVDFVQSKQLPT